MGLTVADLSAKLGLDTSVFDQGISGVLGRINPIGGAALGVGAIATGAVAAIGVAAYKMGAEFDDAYDSIRLGTGATGAQLDGLKDSFKEVVTDVPASFGDASTAIADLNTRLGYTGDQLRDSSDQFLELSRITGTDVAGNVRLGTRLFGDWSIKTKDQAGSLDQLYRATQKSGIGLSDLMGTVVQFGAPLRNMGFGFTDSVAMLSKWEKEGVNTSTVLTGMKFALKTFAAAGKEPQAALAAITTKIHDATNAQTAMTLGMKTFGLRAGPDMVAAIREGRFQYAKFAETIANGSDTIHTAAKDTEDLSESWTKLWNTLKVEGEPALSGLFNAISDFAKDPILDKHFRNLDLLQFKTKELTADLPKQWGQAAARTRDILEDMRKLMKDPMILGDPDAEHTRGQLNNIRDDIVAKLKITVQEANEIMGMLFKGWNPKNSLVAPIKESASQVEARIQKMRDKLARNLRHGHLDNGPLIAKIKAAEAEQAAMRAKFAQSITVGSLNTSGWLGPIRAAELEMRNLRTLVGAGMYAPPIVIDLIKPNVPKPHSGGVFSGPHSGYPAILHSKEAVLPLDHPNLIPGILGQAGINLGGGGVSLSVTGTFIGSPPDSWADFVRGHAAEMVDMGFTEFFLSELRAERGHA